MKSANSQTGLKIKRCIVLASKAFSEASNMIRSRQLGSNTMLRIYKTTIKPVSMCGNEAWTLSNVEVNLADNGYNVGDGKFRRSHTSCATAWSTRTSQ